MMSQSRVRKGAGGDGGCRGRGAGPRVNGVSMSVPVRPINQNHRSRSQNKIPKSVRYDLENALVGLCDVWFEEIKPHLVRNKIKLHVHESGAGASKGAGAASGDHASAAAACPHVDPGAAPDRPQHRNVSSAGCSSMQPTASKVPCRRPRAPSCQPPKPSPTPLDKQHRRHNFENPQPKRPRNRRRHPTSLVSQESRWRVPRLCRTNSIISPRGATGTASQQHRPLSIYHNSFFQLPLVRSRRKLLNKSTQTDLPRKKDVGSQSRFPSPILWRSKRVSRPVSPDLLTSSIQKDTVHGSATASMKKLLLTSHFSTVPSRVRNALPGPRSRQTPIDSTDLIPADCCLRPRSRKILVRESCRELKLEKPRSPQFLASAIQRSEPFGRTPGTTTFFPAKQHGRRQLDADKESPLFKDDLINIIAEKQDNRLRVLFKSPERDDSESLLNLVPSPSDQTKQTDGVKNKPPWK